MPGPLDELRRLLGGRDGPVTQSTPAVPGSLSRPVGVETAGGLLDLSPDEWAAFMRRIRPVGGFMGQDMYRPEASMPSRLPPQDELVKTPFPEGWLTGDMGIVARPYTGPETGDPVINQRRLGTWDRAPGLVNDWRRPFIWENYKRFFEP